jgi:ATP-dependent protease ClpP protease subunit
VWQVLYGQASDVKIEAEEILRMRQKVYRGLMQFTGRTYEQVTRVSCAVLVGGYTHFLYGRMR